MNQVVALPDGFSGATRLFNVAPLAVDGELVKLACAEAGSEHLIRWARKADVAAAVAAATQGVRFATDAVLSRKADSWGQVRNLPAALEASIDAELKALPRVLLRELPCLELGLWAPAPQVFVGLAPDGSWYLVNTEGYDYARYAARLSWGAE